MEFIKEITDKDIGSTGSINDVRYRVRKAARAMILNEKNEIAVLHVSKNNYHKLPGGGIEKDETILNALNREILEETGCKAKIYGEAGIIIEYRNTLEQIQISYCYLAKVTKRITDPSFTKKELHEGFILKWMKMDEALKSMKKDKPNTYEGKFIQKRDIAFLSWPNKHQPVT